VRRVTYKARHGSLTTLQDPPPDQITSPR